MGAGGELLSAGGVSPPPGGRAENIRTSDGVTLRIGLWRDAAAAAGKARGLAVLAPGRTEFIEKHYETVTKLRHRGFAVCVIDWRGQGLSDRLLTDPLKGHVDDFAGYQRDYDAVRARLAEEFDQVPWLLVGHSMGGCISARILMRQEQEGLQPPFRAAVLSAPMLRLHGARAYYALGRAMAETLRALGRHDGYTPGAGAATLADQGFDDNVLTADKPRFDAYAAFIHEHPRLAIAGATWGWFRAALREMPALRPTKTPTLVAIGKEDVVVSVDEASSYAATPAGWLHVLPGARHEPFHETPAVQDTLWKAIDAFLARNFDATPAPADQ